MIPVISRSTLECERPAERRERLNAAAARKEAAGVLGRPGKSYWIMGLLERGYGYSYRYRCRLAIDSDMAVAITHIGL